jgi:hypothetical protein
MNNLNLLGQLTAPTTVGSGDLLGSTVNLNMDSSRIDASVAELARLTETLERFRQRIGGILLSLRLDDALVCVGEPAFRAGNLVCVPQIFSRDVELCAAALRALELDVAHKILDGVVLPNEKS